MFGKSNIRQRAISDYEFVKKKSKSQFIVHLHEGRLYVNVARLGSMYPFVRFSLGTEACKSETSEVGGLNPRWNQFFSFSLDVQKVLELVVLDKSLIFGETEIGRCSILISDVAQRRQTEWWEIISPTGVLAGAVFLSFEFPNSEQSSVHISKNSWDLKMHHHIESSPVVRVKGKHFTQCPKLTPEVKSLSSFSTTLVTETVDIEDYESSRTALIEKQEKFKNLEKMYLANLEKIREESNLIRSEKHEIKKNNEVLQNKEEEILKEKEWIQREWLQLEEDTEYVQQQIQDLNEEYMMLQKEKLRIKAVKFAQENLKKRIEKQKRIYSNV